MNYEEIVEKIKLDIKLHDEKILARVSIDITWPPIIIKGNTIKRSDNNKLFVTPPSFKSKYGYKPMVWMAPDLWKMICKKILQEYVKMTGESIPEEEIDIDEIEL